LWRGDLENPKFFVEKQQKNYKNIVIVPMCIYPSSKIMELNEKIILESRY
jgi:hypothetical protein